MSFVVGLLMTLGVFVFAMNPQNAHLYFHLHSFVLVFGGTFTILIFSSPVSSLKQLKNEIFSLFKRSSSLAQNKNELIQLSKNKSIQLNSTNELIMYAKDLWGQGIAQDLFVVLLSQKRSEIEQRSIDAIQCLKNLAKYPPALGMVGTVIGMVSLFQSLDGNRLSIGPSLALAMTATFLGLALANALIMPMADRLQLKHVAEKNELTQIYQILLLIGQDEATYLIEDEVLKRAA